MPVAPEGWRPLSIFIICKISRKVNKRRWKIILPAFSLYGAVYHAATSMSILKLNFHHHWPSSISFICMRCYNTNILESWNPQTYQRDWNLSEWKFLCSSGDNVSHGIRRGLVCFQSLHKPWIHCGHTDHRSLTSFFRSLLRTLLDAVRVCHTPLYFSFYFCERIVISHRRIFSGGCSFTLF